MAWKFARLTLAAVLVGGVFSLWFGRQEVVRLVGARLLTRQGMGPVQLTIGRVGYITTDHSNRERYAGAAADVGAVESHDGAPRKAAAASVCLALALASK